MVGNAPHTITSRLAFRIALIALRKCRLGVSERTRKEGIEGGGEPSSNGTKRVISCGRCDGKEQEDVTRLKSKGGIPNQAIPDS
jgi:hypothetical protein